MTLSKCKTIADLNIDCLVHICSFLTAIERLQLALVTEIFDCVIVHFVQIDEFRIEELMLNFSLPETEKLLLRFGDHIRKLGPWIESMDETPINDYFQLISTYCRRLEEIEIYYPWRPDFSCYTRLFQSSNYCIKSVTVRQTISGEIDDSLHELLQNTNHLKSLSLFDSDITGKYLFELGNLKTLNLEGCLLVEPNHFIDLCNTVQLESLNIVGCDRLNNLAFIELCSSQSSLKCITISNTYDSRNFEIVGSLKCLREITFCDCRNELFKLEELLEKLEQVHCQDIEEFAIVSDVSYEFRDLGYLIKILKFINLKKLTLPNIHYTSERFLKDMQLSLTKLEDVNISIYDHDAWLTETVLKQFLVLGTLRKLKIGPWYKFDMQSFRLICDVLRMKKTSRLDLFVSERCADDDLIDFLQTPEYKANEKVFRIVIDEFTE